MRSKISAGCPVKARDATHRSLLLASNADSEASRPLLPAAHSCTCNSCTLMPVCVSACLHPAWRLQVEGVCKLVGDVEELVERASRAAAAVQVGAACWCSTGPPFQANPGCRPKNLKPAGALCLESPEPGFLEHPPLLPWAAGCVAGNSCTAFRFSCHCHSLSLVGRPPFGILTASCPLPVQAEYHAEKFRAFPHVNSPARLIRELVRAPGPAPGSKAPRQQQQDAADGKENAMEVA